MENIRDRNEHLRTKHNTEALKIVPLRYRRDVDLEVGRKILSFFDGQRGGETLTKLQDANFEVSCSFVEDKAPSGYRTTEESPRYSSTRSLSPAAPPYSRTEGRCALRHAKSLHQTCGYPHYRLWYPCLVSSRMLCRPKYLH